MIDAELEPDASRSPVAYDGVLPAEGLLAVGRPFEINDALGAGYTSLRRKRFTTKRSLDEVYADVTSHWPADPLDGVRGAPAHGTCQYSLSREAIADLRAIWAEVRTRQTTARATEMLHELISDIGTSVRDPALGRVRSELVGTPHCYSGRYAIYYHPTIAPEGVAIVRVLDGRGVPDEGFPERGVTGRRHVHRSETHRHVGHGCSAAQGTRAG